MGMELTKEFVNSCRKVGVLRDFLCQAIDQVDEKDKEIAELKEQYKDMDVTHTVHIAKMNAYIEELEESHKKEVGQLLMKIAELEKLVETADKFVKQKGGFTVKDITIDGVKLECFKKEGV